MRYSFEIKKFVYSQYVFAGLRTSLGLALPPIFILLVFHDADLGFLVASGAICASVVDLPGPLKYKHNEMLACTGLSFLSSLATGFATASNLTLWLTVVPLTFALSMIVVYPNRGAQISFATLYGMIVNLERHFTPLEAIVNSLWLLGGGLWYTYFSYFVNRALSNRTEQQAIAEAIFATADYMRVRARFYETRHDLDEVYHDLVAKQIAAVDRQDAARDIVLRNLPRARVRAGGERRRAMLFNLFINSVDLHDTIIGSHADYGLLRQSFGDADIMQFFHDLILKSAQELDAIGLAVLQNHPSEPSVSMKAELRAIEYEIDKMRRKQLQVHNAEAYSAIASSYRRVWSVTRLVDRMHRNTRLESADGNTEMSVDQALSRFLASRRFSMKQLWTNLTPSSPSFRHALRVTLAVALGLAIGKLLPLTNSYWIVMTTVIIMKPGFSLTRQRNAQRIVGTVIGCAAAVLLTRFVHDTHALLAMMFVCMFMAYSLVILHYGAATVFISAYVLLLYHLLAPAGMRLIGERAIDTLIGGALAIGISYLYANWEYRLMGPLVLNVIKAMRSYLGAALQASQRPAENGVQSAATLLRHDGPAVAAAAASAGAGRAPDVLEYDFGYRLARKDVHVAFANLGQAFLRMMREPRAQQRFVPEINELLIQSHALASQITASAPLIATLGPVDRRAVDLTMQTVSENLRQAEAGVALPPNSADDIKALNRDLDAMVVAAEKERPAGQDGESADDALEALKALAHQCKQMLKVSAVIRKDASTIRL